MKIRLNLLLLLLFVIATNCKQEQNSLNDYPDDIGDTKFNKELDSSNFKFCDSLNVLHKRALVKYKGGTRQFEEDIIKRYENKTDYQQFSGYFFIRFAVNCNDLAGRFRTEIVDEAFKKINPPKGLENDIITIVKSLNNWKHPVYEGKDYDGYTFTIIKFKNGTILKS